MLKKKKKRRKRRSYSNFSGGHILISLYSKESVISKEHKERSGSVLLCHKTHNFSNWQWLINNETCYVLLFVYFFKLIIKYVEFLCKFLWVLQTYNGWFKIIIYKKYTNDIQKLFLIDNIHCSCQRFS
jgi:hypothetical protein